MVCHSKIKFSLIVFLITLNYSVFSQSFKQGDIVVNGNIGGPKLTPALIRSAIKTYYKINAREIDNFDFSTSSKGLYNGKLEYGIDENFGVGACISYWSMNITATNTYKEIHPVTTVEEGFVDTYTFDLSAMAIGGRANYHFEMDKDAKIDPYIGGALGVTRYSFEVGYNSTYPQRQLPVNTYSWKSGWGPYFSATVGFRYFPVKFIGINGEFGWDRGALFFGGIAFKIGTKKQEQNNSDSSSN